MADTMQDDDDLVVLPPQSIPQEQTATANADDSVSENKYSQEHYLVTSQSGLSPFEQYLGPALFHDLYGEGLRPVLAYTADGGIHPGKVSHFSFAYLTLGGTSSQHAHSCSLGRRGIPPSSPVSILYSED